MEGNGPLTARSSSGTIVLADDPVAADAKLCAFDGIRTSRIVHICEGSRFLGNASPGLVDQAGEISLRDKSIQVVPEFNIFMHFFLPTVDGCGCAPQGRLDPHSSGTVVSPFHISALSRCCSKCPSPA